MTHDSASLAPTLSLGAEEQLTFTTAGETSSALVHWFANGLRTAILELGHIYRDAQAAVIEGSDNEQQHNVRLVLNLCDPDKPRSIRRAGQGTFVATVVEGNENERDVMRAAYPLVPRTLSNMVIYLTRIDGVLEAHFITIEQGHYVVRQTMDEPTFFLKIFERIRPLACSHLVINNEFVTDLPEELWQGDQITNAVSWAGKQLDQLGLLPAVFPLHEYLSERDLRHIRRLYQMGGLSYGNLSARATHNPAHFWMSASGVDKSKLEVVGRDILLVTAFESDPIQMRLSVPPTVEPRRVSVDAIEHWMIYRDHPQVGAIIHVHAWWRDPILSTQVNYPCGTYELAQEVAELVRRAPDPSRAVIGLKNHGLTITGHSIEEIFERINGMIVPQVPMS
ncbi:MAG: class II aldolase/adducin family protein [Roseiflexaceae bacterium]